jgi:hypothetical protein
MVAGRTQDEVCLWECGLPCPSRSRFLRAVEHGYVDNPYHSATHAADVLQTFGTILKRSGMIPGYVDPVTHLACLFAAVGDLPVCCGG